MMKWRKARRERCGHEYAASLLLREGVTAVRYLESKVQTARDFSTYDAFDVGVCRAIQEYQKLLSSEEECRASDPM